MTLISVTLFVALVGAAFLGRRVRRYLPEDHLSAESKDAVKLAMGLVATMTALVLGLLVSSAKGTYDTTRSEVIQMAAKVAFLDRVLALYGPEAAEARVELRAVVADAARRIWSPRFPWPAAAIRRDRPPASGTAAARRRHWRGNAHACRRSSRR